MVEFLQTYGLWIALGGVFVGMHWFGMGCCGGHRHNKEDGPTSTTSEGAAKTQGTTGAAPKSNRSCH
jgi:hypothetical protein